MGLDGVELVMEIEEEFGIRLTDDEVAPVETVGQIIQLVESKITPESRQKLGAAFYRLRQVIADSVLIDKRLIRPTTDLRPFIPVSQVSSVWRELHEAGFHVPSLTLSKRGVLVFVTLWLMFMILAIKAVNYLIPWSGWGVGVGMAAFLFGWIPALGLVFWLASTPMFPSLAAIPASHATVGAIARRWSGIKTEGKSASPSKVAPVTSHIEVGDSSAPDEAKPDEATSDRLQDRTEQAVVRLKEILSDVVGRSCPGFGATAILRDVLARRDRWRAWQALQDAGAPVMPLRLTWFARALLAVPVVAVALYGAVVIIGMFVLLVGAGQIGTALISVGAGLTAVLLFSSAVERALSSVGRAYRLWWLVSDLPKEWTTIGDAARWLAEHGWPYTPAPFTIHSRSVAIRVRQVVAGLVSLPVERITADTRLVDLGI